MTFLPVIQKVVFHLQSTSLVISIGKRKTHFNLEITTRQITELTPVPVPTVVMCSMINTMMGQTQAQVSSVLVTSS